MTTTTIKVSAELRDRLKQQASQAGISLGAHLSRLADLADRRDRLAALKSAVASTPICERQVYADETAAWEVAELTDAVR